MVFWKTWSDILFSIFISYSRKPSSMSHQCFSLEWLSERKSDVLRSDFVICHCFNHIWVWNLVLVFRNVFSPKFLLWGENVLLPLLCQYEVSLWLHLQCVKITDFLKQPIQLSLSAVIYWFDIIKWWLKTQRLKSNLYENKLPSDWECKSHKCSEEGYRFPVLFDS